MSEGAMKNCASYEQELAACATEGEPPRDALAAHLSECSACRESLKSMGRVAEFHRQSAAELRGPARRLEISDSWREGEAVDWGQGYKPVFGFAVVLAVLMTILFLKRESSVPELAKDPAERPSQYLAGNQSEISPTLNEFRHQVERGELPSVNGAPQPLNHFRVKDAYSDLN